jgi:hypothetical protein
MAEKMMIPPAKTVNPPLACGRSPHLLAQVPSFTKSGKAMHQKPTKTFVTRSMLLYLMLALSVCTGLATQAARDAADPIAKGKSQPPAEAEILARFIQSETKFRSTLIHYSFKRDVVLQTIGHQGEVTGEYLRNSVFVLNDRGERVERVIFHPQPTMKELTITKEDIQDLAGSQLFGLELNDLNAYTLKYLSQIELDGRSLYVIGIRPKQTPDPHQMKTRFFVGKVLVDAETFQAVRLEGITEPQGKQRFANFVTQRSTPVHGLFVPSATSADDVLHFPKKDVHYRISVRYYDFKEFASRLSIVELD